MCFCVVSLITHIQTPDNADKNKLSQTVFKVEDGVKGKKPLENELVPDRRKEGILQTMKNEKSERILPSDVLIVFEHFSVQK